MLRLVSIQNRSQVAEIFKNYDPRQQTWIVSDLRTKFELQRKILQSSGYFIDESVLRASDLWKALLKRCDPHIRIVSDPFAKSLLRTMMDENSEVLGVNSSAVETLFSYIDQLSPVLFHPEGYAQIEEWFTQNPESADRWRAWYLRANFCVKKLISEHRIITSDWITSYLVTFNNLEHLWKQPLVIDLSGEVSKVEAEILKTLSRSVDVTVIEPSPQWKNEYAYLLKPYEYLKAESSDVKQLESVSTAALKKETLRFSGMLAEIKNAVGQVRAWLEEGLKPSEIALLAPDIETYWPVLQPFLDEEGIPYQKDSTHKVQSLPSIVKWMASLRSRSGKLSTTDLEIAFYDSQEAKSLRYEEFKALFKSLYVDEDLKRHSLVDKLFSNQLDLSGHLSRDEFVVGALAHWRQLDSESAQIVLRELLQNAVVSTTMPWSEWLGYLETVVAAKEFTLAKGHPDGVLVTKLMSGHSESVTHRIFLGLTDESLKQKSRVQLSRDDYFLIGKDLGFYLANPDQSDIEFELRLLAELPSAHDIYCFGLTDLSGSICSPANFWMSEATDHETLKIPLETRLDQIQASEIKGERELIKDLRGEIQGRIDIDLGKAETPALDLKALPSVSASAIESYLECPFIFSAQRYFRLEDLPDIDLDIDHRTRGQLAHSLFEYLTEEPMRFSWSEEEISEVLEKIRAEKKLIFADDRLWIPLKNKHIRLGQRFLEFEKEWRQNYIHTRTVGREASFKFYFNPETLEFSDEEKADFFRVSGKIDRIDANVDARQLLVIDYKSSAGGIYAHGSWFKNKTLQLLFYLWVIEHKLIPDIDGEVIGLFYYIFRDFTRKGFCIEDFAGSLYPAPKRRDSTATLETREQYKAEFQSIFVNTLKEIRKGKVNPEPEDKKICADCKWRRQCRAPHLN